jgi:asparagine synthase (glutamine-hydrolysing)
METPTRTLAQALCLVRQYGVWRAGRRACFDAARRAGWVKWRFPVWQWSERPAETWFAEPISGGAAGVHALLANSTTRFWFPRGSPPRPNPEWARGAVVEAEGLLRGTFRYFFHREGNLGVPQPDWHLNPFTGRHAPPTKHWCDSRDFEPGRGDIKVLWEPSRFGWVYGLARAYAVSSDERFAECFWRLLESWQAANPPQMGVHWQCGQEIAFRVLACIFGLYAFWASPASSPGRVAQLLVLLAGSAERIIANNDYARMQMGNHAVTEAAALFAVGTLFPQLRDAARWRARGQWVLEDEAHRYNWPDGAYVQHSLNYQRLTLRAYLTAFRLAELNGASFASDTRNRLKKSLHFLYELQDEESGQLPNYGPNDGALLMPLNSCAYADYRPLLGSLYYYFERKRVYANGPWDEDLLWLFGAEALHAPPAKAARESRRFWQGGYFTLRGNQSWAMVRCHSFRNRPGQADLLHVDLWSRGHNLLRDSGTFTYYDPPADWSHYFVSTRAHNTVVVAHEDQMIKGERFRWFSLARSSVMGYWREGDVEVWQGEHYGYRRLPSRVTHRRALCRLGDCCWVVVDDLVGRGMERLDLYWQLERMPWGCENGQIRFELAGQPGSLTILASSPASVTVSEGAELPERSGWQSQYYGDKTAAPTVRASVTSVLPVRFVTLVLLGSQVRLEARDCSAALEWVTLQDGRRHAIKLARCGQPGPMVRELRLDERVSLQVPPVLGRAVSDQGTTGAAGGEAGMTAAGGLGDQPKERVGPTVAAGTASAFSLRAARESDLAELVTVHQRSFPEEFLTLIGGRFIRRFYRFYFQQPAGICLVCLDTASGRLAGAVAGGEPKLRTAFTLNHASLFLGRILVRAAFHARVRARIMSHVEDVSRLLLRASGFGDMLISGPWAPDSAGGHWSNLLSICVEPDYRGKGVGGLLLEGFRRESVRLGFHAMRLSVHDDNHTAIAFYRAHGWREFTATPGGTFFTRSVH